MKKYFTIIFILSLFLIRANSQTGWLQQNSGTGYSLNYVFFLDTNIGYIVGDTTINSSLSAFVILKTTNGGANWINQTPPFPNNLSSLKSVFFLDVSTGFACGGAYPSNIVYVEKTTNGGANWNMVYNQSGNNYSMPAIFFMDALTGIGVGGYSYNPCFFKTTDGGNTWSNYYFLLWNGPLTSVYFLNSLTGYAAGPDSNTFKTTNGGGNWVQMPYAGSIINSVYFINTNTGWMVGNPSPYPIYRTTNSGSTWTPTSNSSYFYSVRFVNDQTGWICGSGGVIYFSTNGGINWIFQTSGIATTLNCLSFVNTQTGWAVGQNGKILKTTTGGITFTQHISADIPINNSLLQNYPNPFNPTTKIKFEISSPTLTLPKGEANVSLKIYDILGREVATLVNEELKPGSYEYEWDGSKFASGVYYYKLEFGNYSETKKMVLIK